MKKAVSTLASQDPRLLWAKAEAEFRRMSDAEKVQTLVAAGVFTPDLKPAKPFRMLFKASKRVK